MAIYGNGIMGPFNGKVGTVVGYMWNGKPCMRAYKRHVANPKTAAQQEHRALFKQEVQLAAKMRWAVTTTLTEAARAAGMTSYNLFVKVNQEAFGSEGGRLSVDYSRLRLSLGEVGQVELRGMEWTADNVLTVNYRQGGGSGYDHVYLYVYVPELETGFLSAPAYRRDRRMAIALPDSYAGHEAVVYLMVRRDDGCWSDSLFAGAIALNEVVANDEEGGAEAGARGVEGDELGVKSYELSAEEGLKGYR